MIYKDLSIFNDLKSPAGSKTTNEIYQAIRNGKFKEPVEKIRTLLADKNDREAESLKRGLPAFTPAGVFSNCRKAECLDVYSQVIILDFDDIPLDEVHATCQKITDTPYTYMAFISPSGWGLKVLVQVDSEMDQHQTAFKQVAAFYEKVTGCTVDPTGKDLARLCFASYDPEAYLNEQAAVFHVSISDQQLGQEDSRGKESPFRMVIERLKKFTEGKIQYQPGSRNSFIHLLACNCNRYGVPEEVVQKLIVNDQAFSDLGSEEKYDTIQSAYRNNLPEHGRFANFAKFAGSPINQRVGDLEELGQTPTIPDEIFENLPTSLRLCCSVVKSLRERDVVFLGALSLLSGCFPDVTGLYRKNTTAANLFVFITAPAASGKGALEETRYLVSKIHKKLTDESDIFLKKYQVEAREARAQGVPLPKHPPKKRLFFPANSSSAMIMHLLNDNKGKGILFETEADTLRKTLKQDWGDFSDNLRKAFHHETMSSCRKDGLECIDIENPKVSVLLSGTPAQVTSLFGSSENGLFSRFVFYAFDGGSRWESVADDSNDALDFKEHFASLGEKIQHLYDLYESKKMRFDLPVEFAEVIDLVFSDRLEEVNLFNEGAESVVKRLGLINFRIAMLLTTIRVGERCLKSSELLPEVLTCSDVDFQTAIQLTSTLYQHSLLIFRALPGQSTSNFGISADKMKFFNNLPVQFKREEAVKAGEGVKLTKDIVDKLLRRLIQKGVLRKNDYGHYEKVQNGKVAK